ncbi:group III truncated hemoglobin [Pedobacter namyangjuensis]|uniref:group III truncated hemoglobin n=1 Tax=Pedobacter namyangjuensis TaxID=600626 RepID=UPI001F06143B|nr:group III truncated hemoglobin [Pedobacter namyangjuensis]
MNAIEKHDIGTLDDIKLLVDTFYGKIRKNELLGPIFNGILKDRWPAHLEKMYRFWQTVLLEQHTYTGSPFMSHAKLPVEKLHFDTWLKIWYATVDDFFKGSKADEAKWRGEKMAEMFLYKIIYYQNNSATPIL